MLFLIFISPTFATEINNPATCDSGTLSTDTGPTNLRANYESNTLNLRWYDDDNNRINVSSSSDSCIYGGAINLPTPPTKRGYTFKGWKVIQDYTPIEYLQTTGNEFQYIDTGVPGDNNNYRIITDFMPLNFPDGSHVASVFTSDYPGASGHNVWRLLFYHGRKVLFYTNTHTTHPRPQFQYCPVAQIDHRYLIDMDYNRIIVNGTTYTPDNLHIGTTNNTTIKLFPSLSFEFPMIIRIYSFKIYDNGTLIRDMIPVKDLSGVACMYDKVSGQFFYNAGTGNFIAGPDL